MRIGILTYHFSDNYGALLQAYALRRWLIQQGYTAEFINYHPDHVEAGGQLKLPVSKENIKADLKILFLYITSIRRRLFGDERQDEKFRQFREDTLGVDSTSYATLAELQSAKFDHDAMIAGSDQIWNPSPQKGLDPAYFLSFAPRETLRMSYAASFGKDSLAPEFHDEARELIRQLDAVSIREKSGVQIIQQLLDREVSCVPDPTLLHTEYDDLLKLSEDQHEGHVFCYALRTAEGIREVAELAARHNNTHIISPYNMHRRWREIGKTVYSGPADWIKQIKRAQFVVTNSFHGTVFSIVFKKPFIVVGLPGSKADLNARVKNLLGSLGLMDRFVEADQWQNAENLLKTPIDWAAAEEKQLRLRNTGIEFLQQALSKAHSK